MNSKSFNQQWIAYVPVRGVAAIEQGFELLFAWIQERQIVLAHGQLFTMYLDSFRDTPPDQVRMWAGVMLKEEVEASGEIKVIQKDMGSYMTKRLQTSIPNLGSAWGQFFAEINAQNVTINIDESHLPFELYHNNFKEDTNRMMDVELCIPVK